LLKIHVWQNNISTYFYSYVCTIFYGFVVYVMVYKTHAKIEKKSV